MDIKQRFDVIDQIRDRTEHLISKMNKPAEWFEPKAIKMIMPYDRIIKKSIKGYEKANNYLMASNELVIKSYNDVAIKAYPLARYTGIPWNYIWLWFWKYLRNYGSNPLFVRGIHFITALQGGGKSSIMYHLMEELRERTGKASYVNADIEKEKLDEDLKIYYKWHKYFDFSEFFGVDKTTDEDGNDKTIVRQKKQFNTKYFNNLVLDEWLSQMNHRVNTTSEYKQVFIPLMSSLSRMRHQKLQRVYIASQLDTTDIQLMGLFKMIHEVEIDLDIDYWQWIEDGMFTEHIKGWKVWTYVYKRNKKRGATEKTLLKKWYYKRTCDMQGFETLSQSKEFYHLPIDQIKTTKGVLS